MTRTLGNISLIAYFATDHPLHLHSIGFWRLDKKLLSKIDFIDSSGLGALVQLAKQWNEGKRRFLIVGNSRVVQTVKLVRLEAFLNLQPDLPTALGHIAAA